jgi:hypothetical protein
MLIPTLKPVRRLLNGLIVVTASELLRHPKADIRRCALILLCIGEVIRLHNLRPHKQRDTHLKSGGAMAKG